MSNAWNAGKIVFLHIPAQLSAEIVACRRRGMQVRLRCLYALKVLTRMVHVHTGSVPRMVCG